MLRRKYREIHNLHGIDQKGKQKWYDSDIQNKIH